MLRPRFVRLAAPALARATIAHRASPSVSSAAPLVAARRWNQQAAAESHLFDEHDGLRRRLLYRSKQRGWLEMDIMLGNWVRAPPHV